MPTEPSIWDSSHKQSSPPFPRATARIVSLARLSFLTTAMTRFSFGTEERDYFGWLPAESARTVPDSLIDTIRSMVCHARTWGERKHALAEQFVLGGARAGLAAPSDETTRKNDYLLPLPPTPDK